jgi:regulator of replication initiation timing
MDHIKCLFEQYVPVLDQLARISVGKQTSISKAPQSIKLLANPHELIPQQLLASQKQNRELKLENEQLKHQLANYSTASQELKVNEVLFAFSDSENENASLKSAVTTITQGM